MIIVQDLTLEGGNIPTDDSEHFYELPIPGEWMKIAYVKLVQITNGKMNCTLCINELSNLDDGIRTNLYAQVFRRHITLADTEGAQYGETLTDPLPYKDREATTALRRLHIAIINHALGTASEFALVVKLADIGEDV
jgi:hypothetical protein